MPTITINYSEQVMQSKSVEVPAFLTNNGIFFKVLSENTCIQVITGPDTTIRKWTNAVTVTRLFSDNTYSPCTEQDFTNAFQTAINSLSE